MLPLSFCCVTYLSRFHFIHLKVSAASRQVVDTFCSLLSKFLNVEVSDTTGDAIIAAAG
jgi:hypothetical protein